MVSSARGLRLKTDRIGSCPSNRDSMRGFLRRELEITQLARRLGVQHTSPIVRQHLVDVPPDIGGKPGGLHDDLGHRYRRLGDRRYVLQILETYPLRRFHQDATCQLLHLKANELGNFLVLDDSEIREGFTESFPVPHEYGCVFQVLLGDPSLPHQDFSEAVVIAVRLRGYDAAASEQDGALSLVRVVVERTGSALGGDLFVGCDYFSIQDRPCSEVMSNTCAVLQVRCASSILGQRSHLRSDLGYVFFGTGEGVSPSSPSGSVEIGTELF